MATTGIWKVKTRLDNVIRYIENEEKTLNDNSYKELHNLKEYLDTNIETENICFVSGINCIPETAYKDMMFTKRQFEKTDGILGFHAFQSFKEGEVTPELAHEIGVKLAEEMWGDRFEVVVATHTNTNHIHNHFVINSVSFKDGKKYSDNRTSYAKLRSLSDSLCEEYGLSVVLEKAEEKGKIKYSNYYKSYIKNSNYHTLAKEDLDRAIAMAYSYKDFLELMEKMGYEVVNRYNKLSIIRSPYKKTIRIERAFGEEYSIDRINKRIELESAPRVPFIEEYNPNNRQKIFKKYQKIKSKGLYGLYKYYCYLLKVYPRHYPKKILTPAMRVEVNHLEDISKETQLLVSNKINTYEQLLFYKNNLTSEVEDLVSKRHNLWIKHKRVTKDEDKVNIRKEIDIISNSLKKKKEEVRLCDEIIKRSGEVEKNIAEFEKEKDKEVERNGRK